MQVIRRLIYSIIEGKGNVDGFKTICDQFEEMLDSIQGEFEFENKAKIVSYLLVNT